MNVNITHLDHALRMVFTPLCRLLIRCGVPVRHVISILKESYVAAAEAEIEARSARLSISEISRLTGITRQEVSQYRRCSAAAAPVELDYPVRDAVVLSTWSKNTNFVDEGGKPLALPMKGDGPSFSQLVSMSYEGADPEAMAARLLASGNITREDDGRLRLVIASVSVNTNVPQLILDVLAAPATTLIPNTQPDPTKKFCQRVAFIARPSHRRINACRVQMRRRITNFIEETDQHLVALAAADSMTEKISSGPDTGKIGVGAFYFELDD